MFVDRCTTSDVRMIHLQCKMMTICFHADGEVKFILIDI